MSTKRKGSKVFAIVSADYHLKPTAIALVH
jgi:hypothetical protein